MEFFDVIKISQLDSCLGRFKVSDIITLSRSNFLCLFYEAHLDFSCAFFWISLIHLVIDRLNLLLTSISALGATKWIIYGRTNTRPPCVLHFSYPIFFCVFCFPCCYTLQEWEIEEQKQRNFMALHSHYLQHSIKFSNCSNIFHFFLIWC